MARCQFCSGSVLVLDGSIRCLLCAREPNERYLTPDELREEQRSMADELVARAMTRRSPLRDERR